MLFNHMMPKSSNKAQLTLDNMNFDLYNKLTIYAKIQKIAFIP
jgi:hypothetical protein